MYEKTGSRFMRKYGYTLKQLAKDLNVSIGALSTWDRQGFDIFYKAKELVRNREITNAYLTRLWANLKSRCGNPKDKGYKYYGGKGIRLRINKSELLTLWIRDEGHKLKCPSIDRIDSFKDYEFSNCRFIEMQDNRHKSYLERLQF